MKYTRYDLKKKRNDGIVFLSIVVATLVVALLIGTIMSNLFLKNSKNISNETKLQNSSVNTLKPVENGGSVKFIAIQEGKYEKKENAEEGKNILSAYGNPFTIQDQNATRVFLGIYAEQEAEKIVKTLTEKNVPNSKMSFEISKSDLCNATIVEIIDANLQILTKISEKDIKSYKTDELKKWNSSLQEVDKNSKNYNILKELKDYINSMPNELAKDKAQENYEFLYNELKKLTTK